MEATKALEEVAVEDMSPMRPMKKTLKTLSAGWK